MIYDYLFYKSYQLAQKSKNFEDTPLLGGMWSIMLGVIFNFFTIVFVLDKILDSCLAQSNLLSISKYVLGGIFVFALVLYFRVGGRWKKIIAKYDKKEQQQGRSIHPLIPILIYHFLSIVLMFLAAMYLHS